MRTLSIFVRKRLRQWQDKTGEHLGDDLLTAFAEQNVSSRERASVLKHLAECSLCREVYALRSEASLNPVLKSKPAMGRDIEWGWRIAAAAATVCVAIAGLWQFGGTKHSSASYPVNVKKIVPAPAAPPISAASLPLITTSKQLVKAKRPAAPLIIEAPPPLPTELVAGTGSAAAPNSPDGTKSSIVTSNQSLPPAQTIDAASRTFARALAQREEVRPNAMFASQSAIAAGDRVLQLSPTNTRSIWSLEALPGDGTINRSQDGGRTWQTITIDNLTPLYVLSAAGSSVWVGGSTGKLFHSVNDGVSWTPIQLTEEGAPVHDRIVSLEANGEGVRVKTDSGLVFVTTDSGIHWRRE